MEKLDPIFILIFSQTDAACQHERALFQSSEWRSSQSWLRLLLIIYICFGAFWLKMSHNAAGSSHRSFSNQTGCLAFYNVFITILKSTNNSKIVSKRDVCDEYTLNSDWFDRSFSDLRCLKQLIEVTWSSDVLHLSELEVEFIFSEIFLG